jgi:hypothetical protein
MGLNDEDRVLYRNWLRQPFEVHTNFAEAR